MKFKNFNKFFKSHFTEQEILDKLETIILINQKSFNLSKKDCDYVSVQYDSLERSFTIINVHGIPIVKISLEAIWD